MTASRPLSERAIILAPTGRDAQVAVQILQETGIGSEVSADLVALCGELQIGAGLVILADEAIHTNDLRPLAAFLRGQPPWSDLPIILLTHRGGGPELNPAAARLGEILGNVTFVERPFHPTTLVSVARAAVRARQRQYEARTRLEDLAASEQRLQERVEARTAELRAEAAEREKAEEQLRQAQKMETIGQLTGGIAHDFNNLLMAVISNLGLLEKRVGSDAQSMRLIDGALQGAHRGASLTRRLLAFSRQQELNVVSTDLGELLRGMSDLLERSLGPRVVLLFNIPDRLPPALIDANQIELAILNLAINARDAMPDGGSIVVAAGEAEAPAGRGLPPGTYLRVTLTDSGTGMDQATLQKAVEPFFSTKPIGKGTGLGLSTVHGVVVQLGGLFELSSTVGKGTVATLWLPIAAQAPKIAAPRDTKPLTARTATILVVDDDPLIAMSTVALLEDLGHVVIEANSGEQAVEILKRMPVDLLITDHAMPGMTGTQLAKIARGIRPDLPILLATGYAELPAGDTIDLPRLEKPYQQREIQAEIARLLPSH